MSPPVQRIDSLNNRRATMQPEEHALPVIRETRSCSTHGGGSPTFRYMTEERERCEVLPGRVYSGGR